MAHYYIIVCLTTLLIRIPLNSKQNLADESLRINRAQPVYI